jgi:hypothetical protein
MADITILQQGTEAKCFVNIKNVAMEDVEFKVELIYGYRRTTIEIDKSKMSQDTQGKWFFIFETTGMVGVIVARCTWLLGDTDCPDGERTKVNEQPLCFVASTASTLLVCPPGATGNQPVEYTFTDASDISSEFVRLCDCDGHPLATADDLYLYARADVAQQIQEALDNIESNNE